MLLYRKVLTKKFYFLGGIIVGIVRVLTFLVGMIGFFAPFKRRGLLIAHSISIIITAIALLILGAKVWFKTLDERNFFKDVWIEWKNGTRARFQNEVCTH